MTFRALYFLGFRVGVYFLENHFNLFQFQVDDVVHQPLGQLHMFLEQIEIEIGFRRERVDHVSVKVDGQQAATVIRAKRYLAAGVRAHGAETKIGIIVSQNKTPGSALFHALCTIFFHKSCALMSLATMGEELSMGYCCV